MDKIPLKRTGRLLFLLAGSIFVIEFSIMILLFGDNRRFVLAALADASLLVLVLFPALYFFSYRPMFREIMARKQSQRIQKQLLWEAEDALRKRDEFISIASHELKTPLTTLTLQVQLFQRLIDSGKIGGVPSEAAEQLLASCRHQLSRYSTLINELLDVSRIGAASVVLEPQEVDLSEVVRDALKELSAELKRERCEVRLQLEEGVRGNWDRSRLQQVITNLLTNAMRYGDRKPIEIVTRKEDGRASLRVRDFGIGIKEEDQQRVFDKFERASSAAHFGGLGLGLYICRQIIDAHRGSIRVQSRPHEGSTFTVELPC